LSKPRLSRLLFLFKLAAGRNEKDHATDRYNFLRYSGPGSESARVGADDADIRKVSLKFGRYHSGALAALSRTIHEEVQFDTEKVTSVHRASHPTLRHSDVPVTIDIVLANGDPNPNRPDLPPYRAGEAACKPMLAATANAIHDATGVRLRRVPFPDGRVLAALKAARL
jgi:hypothetical protein